MYAVKKGDRYVKDFSNGDEFTKDWNWIQKFVSRRAALEAAREYGKEHGRGYHVIELF